jgi:hypothetical protein
LPCSASETLRIYILGGNKIATRPFPLQPTDAKRERALDVMRELFYKSLSLFRHKPCFMHAKHENDKDKSREKFRL